MSSLSKVIAALTFTKFSTVLAITLMSFHASAEKPASDKDVQPKPLTCSILPKCKND